MFWQLHHDKSPILCDLAERVLHTLANSVPCERFFSSIAILHTDRRSKLSPEHVDKLLYIQINRRTLKRDLKTVLPDLSPEDDAMPGGLWEDSFGCETPIMESMVDPEVAGEASEEHCVLETTEKAIPGNIEAS
jgi:hAT family C-terminal dimerisation region